jgi:hypothetical protein
VAGYIDMNAEEEDLLLFNAGFPQVAFDYYSTKKDLIKKPFPKKDAIGHPSSYAVDRENIRLLFPIVNAHKRIWLILSYTAGGNKNLIINALNENYHLSYEEKYMNIDVYLFEKNEKTPFPK